MAKTTIFWHRRDLRIDDNAGLFYALKEGGNVRPIFIFDRDILDALSDKKDARVSFIYNNIEKLKAEYRNLGTDLRVYYGTPKAVFSNVFKEFEVANIYTNRDYEPYAVQRDREIASLAEENGANFYTFKDQCIFEKDEVVKKDGDWYSVFTPYSKVWKSKLNDFYLKSYPITAYNDQFQKADSTPLISLSEMGFAPTDIEFPKEQVNEEIIEHYHETRDIPSVRGTTRMSVHLRFGTVSIRKLAQKAMKNEKYLNELIWRDFYMMILHHNPHVVTKSFRPEYDQIQWEDNEEHFNAWCEGRTGYPIVDAGMRELNATGFMHNRVRMIVSSFLVKHLLIDWRKGEAYFAEKLLDYELSSNNGGWQWAAGSGCDAAPYFRVFNPELQTKKFDPDLKYIRKWVPEFEDFTKYPKPIVDHKMARERALERYKSGLNRD
jgi:deoxyribodipyrimidine photo-lyase